MLGLLNSLCVLYCTDYKDFHFSSKIILKFSRTGLIIKTLQIGKQSLKGTLIVAQNHLISVFFSQQLNPGVLVSSSSLLGFAELIRGSLSHRTPLKSVAFFLTE